MPVSIRIVGDVARLVGAGRVEIDMAGCTVGAALDALVMRHPRLGTELFDEKGRIRYMWVLASERIAGGVASGQRAIDSRRRRVARHPLLRRRLRLDIRRGISPE